MNYNLENVSQLSNLFKETSIDYGWRVFLIHWLRPYQTKSVKTLQRFCRRMSGYYVKNNKYWAPVARVDNVFGDRNLVCSCPSMDEYKDEAA